MCIFLPLSSLWLVVLSGWRVGKLDMCAHLQGPNNTHQPFLWCLSFSTYMVWPPSHTFTQFTRLLPSITHPSKILFTSFPSVFIFTEGIFPFSIPLFARLAKSILGPLSSPSTRFKKKASSLSLTQSSFVPSPTTISLQVHTTQKICSFKYHCRPFWLLFILAVPSKHLQSLVQM